MSESPPRTPILTRLRWPGREPLPVEPGPTTAVIARTFMYLYGAGGTLAIFTLLLPGLDRRSELGIAAPGIAALGVALGMLVFFDRVPPWIFPLLPPLGTCLASIVVYSGGPHSVAAYAGFYFWVVLSSFYLFDTRWAWANVAFVGVAFAVVLLSIPEKDNRAVSWVMVMGALAVGGGMIGLLRTRLERLVGELQALLERTRIGEHNLEEAQRIATVGSWEYDLRTQRFSGSAEFFRIIGSEAEAGTNVTRLDAEIHPDDLKHVIEAYRTGITEHRPIVIDHRIIRPDGELRILHSRGQAIVQDGVAVKLFGTAQDVTERKQQEERLRRTLRQLRATTDVALALGEERNLSGLLALIAQRTRSLLHAAGVGILVADGDRVRVAASDGETQALGELSASDVGDMMAAGVGRLSEGMIIAPLSYRDAVHGLLVALGEGRGDGFTEEDERVMRSFASSAATAVANAKTVQQDSLRRSIEASERERRRWARELHDQTLQGLGVLQMRLENALRGGPEDLDAAAATGLEQIASEVEALRRIIADLRPALLDEFGLAPALEALVQRVTEQQPIDATLRVNLGETANGRPNAELERTIYRLVQEALTNVCKHAGASHASVEVTATNGTICVRVTDDGHGFSPNGPAAGFGLPGMRERVGLVNGRLEVSSGASGTTVEATLPVVPRPNS